MLDFAFTTFVLLFGLILFVGLSAWISIWFYHQGILHATKAISYSYNLGLSVEEVKDIMWRVRHDMPLPASYGERNAQRRSTTIR